MLDKPKIITQHFGNNKNKLFYGGFGHTGLDYFVPGGVGAYIHSLADGEVLDVLKVGDDPRIDYWELRVKWEHDGKIYRLGYGHIAGFCVEPGDKIKRGQIIAIQGNGGNVASNGVKVSEQARLNGSKKGAHVHFSIKEIDENGGVKNWDKNSRGNLNPYLFMAQEERPEPKKPLLRIGDRGDDVKILQALLGFKGNDIDGIFGPITLSAVRSFQEKEGLLVDGVVGKVTWSALLNNE